MSTRVVRSVNDFMRHRMDVDLECYCGHKNTLPRQLVFERFRRNNWPRSLDGALRHFVCSKCGSRPKWIGPQYR